MAYDYWVIYDTVTGGVITTGSGVEGAAQAQPLNEGWAVMVIPSQAMRPLGQVDLPTIKASYAASIDQDANKVCSMFITNTPSQMATYLVKEVEARGVLAGDDAPTVFLSTEAEAIGVSVPDLALEVVAQADIWRPIGARIEAARRKAKLTLLAAENLVEIAAAIAINWREVVEPPEPEPEG